MILGLAKYSYVVVISPHHRATINFLLANLRIIVKKSAKNMI